MSRCCNEESLKVSISVLMATYWKESPVYLTACLESLEKQTLKPDEVIVVKDGVLTDELEAVLTEFRERLPIKEIDNPDSGGVGRALMVGLDACSFDLIARMDTDDICEPSRLEKQSKLIKPNCVISSSVREFDGEEMLSKRVATDVTRPSQMYWRNPVNHMSAMFYREDVLAAGGYKPLLGFEDWYLWLRMYKQGANFMGDPEVLVRARIGDEFIKRRRGPLYIRNEVVAFFRFWREGLIPGPYVAASLLARLPARVVPVFLFKYLFKRHMRKD
jgi:amylovoran biosynthesis glycosyltransferase AmsE